MWVWAPALLPGRRTQEGLKPVGALVLVDEQLVAAAPVGLVPQPEVVGAGYWIE